MTKALLEKSIAPIVKKSVLAVIGELLEDPDFGLTFKKGFEAKLRKSIKEKNLGKTHSLSEVKTLLRVK